MKSYANINSLLRNAEAAPKSGFVTPSTSWWARLIKGKICGFSVKSRKDCAPAGCTNEISRVKACCIFVQQAAAQIA
jgi:hypothetical protein